MLLAFNSALGKAYVNPDWVTMIAPASPSTCYIFHVSGSYLVLESAEDVAKAIYRKSYQPSPFDDDEPF